MSRQIVLRLTVKAPSKIKPNQVALIVDRLIAVGLNEAEDSLEDSHGKEAEIALTLIINKATVFSSRN